MSRHRSLLPTTVAAVLLALTTAGCSGSAASEAGKPYTVGVTTLFPTGTFAEFVSALETAGAGKNLSFDVQDVANNASRENTVLTAFATRKVNLVVASVVSPTGSVAAMTRLKSAGVPVICYNTCLGAPHDQQLARAFVTNNQEDLGKTTGTAAAEYIKTQLGGKAKVAFLTCESFDVCKQRRAGLEDALKSVETTTVAAQEGFQVDKATPIANAILSAHPDTNVFIAENEDAVIAAANAIKSRNLTGKVAVFGIGINPTVANLMLQGTTVKQVTGQDAAAWATTVVQLAEELRAGKAISKFDQFTPGPSFTDDEPAPIREYLKTHTGS